MAGKNRKRVKSGGFAFPLPAAVLLTLTATLLLLYVWLDAQAHVLGAHIKRLEQELAVAEKAHDHELWKWERMKSPAGIERALARHRLVMVVPEAADVVRIPGRGAVMNASTPGDLGHLARLERSGGAGYE